MRIAVVLAAVAAALVLVVGPAPAQASPNGGFGWEIPPEEEIPIEP